MCEDFASGCGEGGCVSGWMGVYVEVGVCEDFASVCVVKVCV